MIDPMEFINKEPHFHNFVKDILADKKKAPFLFVGAGISIDSQLPTWSEFINSCVQNAFGTDVSTNELAHIHNTEVNDIWLIDAACQQAVTQSISETELLRKALWGEESEHIKPSPLHYLLVQYAKLVNVPIFTTNYDDLLEQAALKLNITVKSFYKPDPRCNLNKFCIVHLHGFIPRNTSKKSTMVASKGSYYNQYNHEPIFIKKFSVLLMQRSCLFIGTSLKDDNINRCLYGAKEKHGPIHYWFTQHNFDSLYQKLLFQDLWSYLNISPLYCHTRFFDEIKTAFRRAITAIKFIEHNNNQITINSEMYSSIQKLMAKILKDKHFQTLKNKCVGPFDETEIDLYLDFSNKSDNKISMNRIWSESTSYTNFNNKAKRNFNISTDLNDSFYSDSNKHIPTLVKETIDTVAIHRFIRTPELAIDANYDDGAQDPRAWAYISFPVFIPTIARCGAIFIFKYLNKNNKIFKEKNNYNKKLDRDIIKLGAYLADQLRSAIYKE